MKCGDTSNTCDLREIKAVPRSDSPTEDTDTETVPFAGLVNVFGVKLEGFSH